MERAGAAVVIPDEELSGPRLAQEVGRLLGDRARLSSMAQASAELARPEAASEIAGELLAAARTGGRRRPGAPPGAGPPRVAAPRR
jgi:UDP-N-acetylglucosamine--N-acetylmuramyl-(pentapeptide) pyrophosphoryl-undecaprenol N-acetylglucosamine transferase